MRSIQSRLVNQTILMVNRTFSIQQILFDSIQSIQSRVNQTPVCLQLGGIISSLAKTGEDPWLSGDTYVYGAQSISMPTAHRRLIAKHLSGVTKWFYIPQACLKVLACCQV